MKPRPFFQSAFLAAGLLMLPLFLAAQNAGEVVTLHFQPVFQQKNIVLDQPMRTAAGDSLALHTLRLYLCNFVFLKQGAAVWAEKNSHHLLDLEDTSTLALRFEMPTGAGFDEIKFDLGVDSVTNASGALGGDLDPTKGMYWTWQSGYINAKIEGFSERITGRNGEFQFHLGGFLSPFRAVQTVAVQVGSVQNASDLRDTNPADLHIDFDLAPFFEKIDWAKRHSVMSPSAEAVRLSEVLAQSFSIHAK